jgi:hypothetical protein
MKKILFFLTIILANSSFGQKPDTTYFSEKRNKVATYGEANFFRLTKKENDTTYSIKEYYTADKSLYMKGIYYDKELTLMDGQFLYYSEEGELIKEENFKKGIKEGRFYFFEKKYKLKKEYIYANDTILRSDCIDSANVSFPCPPRFPEFDVPAKFKGNFEEAIMALDFQGHKCLNQSSIYIMLQFTVTVEGNAVDFEIIESNCPVADKFAVDSIGKLGKWKPATFKGNYVPMRIALPIFIENY